MKGFHASLHNFSKPAKKLPKRKTVGPPLLLCKIERQTTNNEEAERSFRCLPQSGRCISRIFPFWSCLYPGSQSRENLSLTHSLMIPPRSLGFHPVMNWFMHFYNKHIFSHAIEAEREREDEEELTCTLSPRLVKAFSSTEADRSESLLRRPRHSLPYCVRWQRIGLYDKVRVLSRCKIGILMCREPWERESYFFSARAVSPRR